MPIDLLPQLNQLKARIDNASAIILGLDFDGTLTPIREHPGSCWLSSELRRVLTAIAAIPCVKVGIISGRSLEDLQARVAIPGIAYAGNHGLEINDLDTGFREPISAALVPDLAQLTVQLAETLGHIPGCWVENKRLSASVHFREVAPVSVPHVLELVERTTANARSAQQFVLRSGKCVVEIRPNVPWHKGEAVRWLADHALPSPAAGTLIFCGDDATDEDVFRIWPQEITIRVGEGSTTAANFTVPDTEGIGTFLAWLRTTLESRT